MPQQRRIRASRLLRGLLAATLLALATPGGAAGQATGFEACLDYPTFAQPAGLNLVGTAAPVENTLQLNPLNGGLGAAWFGTRMPVVDGFTTDFDFRITPPFQSDGADGLAFVIQDQAPDAIGEGGGGIGYQGITHSLAVEFDTWQNDGNEPAENHVAVHSRGPDPNSVFLEGQLAQPVPVAAFEDGKLHHARVVYVPGRLDVFLDDTTTPILSVAPPARSPLEINGGPAFVGFTAATGLFVEDQRIESWRFCGVQRPATLRVVTNVVNDNGGTTGPGGFTVHVRAGGADVGGSPQPGSGGGSAYSLAAGTYGVAAEAVSGYAISVGGDCSSDGAVTLAPGESKQCTVTADDIAQQPSPLPPPEAGETVNALPKSGTVRVKIPGTTRFFELEEGQQIPVGSVVDTTKGSVTIVAAGEQAADFFDGIFRLKQGKGAKPLTILKLVEKLRCPKAGKAVAAATKKKRRLWGDGSGRFRTEGKYSSATVRGTKWLVEDRCTSTLTRVTRGSVRVRDAVKRKTVVVRAGKQYVARAKG